jgi:HK97 family phage major capsid protein
VKAQTLQVGQDPAGGYWVTPDTSGRIVKKVYESTPMRQLATVVSIGTDKLEGPIDNGEADAAWVGETTTRAQTDTPQLGMWEIPVHELYAYPKVTQKLLEDAKIDVEAWLADKSTSQVLPQGEQRLHRRQRRPQAPRPARLRHRRPRPTTPAPGASSSTS